MQLAVFGGSFDPIHIAHEAIVNKALKTLEIDKIIVVPTYLNPFKSSFHLEPKTRFNLLKKVFENNSQVNICDYEINQNRPVYSIETIKYLKNLYNPSKIYIIIGADNVESLDKWSNIDELKSLAQFVVAKRAGFESEKLKDFKTLDLDIDISSTKLRDKIDISYIPDQIKDEVLQLHKTN